MPKHMFETLFNAVVADGSYLCSGLRPNCTGKLGASPLQNVVTAFRYIAYWWPADSLDKTIGLSETTTLLWWKAFCRSVNTQFGHKYLRTPTVSDIVEIERRFAEVGFPGCIGCVACAGWEWSCVLVLQDGKRREFKSCSQFFTGSSTLLQRPHGKVFRPSQ